MGKRLVNLFAGRGPGVFVKLAMQVHVELKELEPLQVEPLMHEAGDKLIRTWIFDQPSCLLTENIRLVQFVLFGEVQ